MKRPLVSAARPSVEASSAAASLAISSLDKNRSRGDSVRRWKRWAGLSSHQPHSTAKVNILRSTSPMRFARTGVGFAGCSFFARLLGFSLCGRARPSATLVNILSTSVDVISVTSLRPQTGATILASADRWSAAFLADNFGRCSAPYRSIKSSKRDGVALGNIVSADVTYANNLDRIETIRSDARIDGADPTIAALTGKIDVRFADTTLLTQAINGTAAALEFSYALGSGESLTLTAHAVYLPRPRIEIKGPKGVQASFDWQAALATSPARMCTVVLVNTLAGYP